jgi:hypothetical protein
MFFHCSSQLMQSSGQYLMASSTCRFGIDVQLVDLDVSGIVLLKHLRADFHAAHAQGAGADIDDRDFHGAPFTDSSKPKIGAVSTAGQPAFTASPIFLPYSMQAVDTGAIGDVLEPGARIDHPELHGLQFSRHQLHRFTAPAIGAEGTADFARPA